MSDICGQRGLGDLHPFLKQILLEMDRQEGFVFQHRDRAILMTLLLSDGNWAGRRGERSRACVNI